MAEDTITKLLKQVASGKVSVKDARVALEEATLTEEQMDAAINHEAFNPAELWNCNFSLASSIW